MDYRLSDAYTYFFESDNWFRKLVFLSMLNMPVIAFVWAIENDAVVYSTFEFFLLFFLAMLSMAISFGYCARCTQNLIYLKTDNLNILPAWENRLTDYLLLGLKKTWFYIKAGFAVFPLMFLPRNFFVVDVGFDMAIEGVFCKHFDQLDAVNYSSILSVVRENWKFYYKMAFMASLVPISFILLIPLFLWLHIEIGIFFALSPFVFTYYILVLAYFAAISAKNMEFNSIKN